MGIVEDVKNVAKLVQQIDNVELYRKILNLQAEAMEMVGENRALKARIRELEEEKQRDRNLVHRFECYWEQRNGKDIGPLHGMLGC